jgi:glyoxylase-like metal-dependent hydrolase (beta-lactamase superfamily II)
LSLFEKAAIYGMNPNISTQTILDNEIITVNGKTVQVIATPGHADDSVCFLVDEQYLFAGDNMSLKDGKVGLFNSIYNKSDKQQEDDIARLNRMDGIRYVITAHYGFAENPVYP